MPRGQHFLGHFLLLSRGGCSRGAERHTPGGQIPLEYTKVFPIALGGGLGLSRGLPQGVPNLDMLHARTPGGGFSFSRGFPPGGYLLWNVEYMKQHAAPACA